MSCTDAPRKGHSSLKELLTLVVNARGALMALGEKGAPEQRLLTQNTNIGEQKECRVVSVKKELAGPTKVAVEFTRPSATFWRIAYPPPDWSK